MDTRVVATVRTSEREEVRVTFEEYHGTRMVGVRMWYRARDETVRPSSRRIKIRIALLPELAFALAKAAREAKVERLLAGYSARRQGTRCAEIP